MVKECMNWASCTLSAEKAGTMTELGYNWPRTAQP
jgi:hypothetical protein